VITIRETSMNDLHSLGQVAYKTGFFGASAERFFPDPELFADLWVLPYLRGDRRCSLVAERDGAVLGYILGSRHPGRYRRELHQTILGVVLPKILRARYRNWTGALRYLARMTRYAGKHADKKHYPAHLHINLLPHARGQGLGRKLLERHLDCLKADGVPGVQLSTTLENEAAVRLYEAFGFRVLQQYQSPLWEPWLGRPATHLIMGLELSR
jgi:ribosomal protein S18 acetylase RimI-like enzyme